MEKKSKGRDSRVAPRQEQNDCWSLFAGGARLVVRARPHATGGRARSPHSVDLPEGKRAIEIAVAAAPEGGKANKAIIEVLARELGLMKGALSIKAGQTGRLKIIEIKGDSAQLEICLKAWINAMVDDRA